MSKAQNIVTSVTVEINAPASVVWDVLIDLPRYGEWNSFCVAAESTLKVGDPINMQVNVTGTDMVVPVKEFIATVEPEQLLSWEQRATPENKDAARRDQYIEAVDAERSRYFTTDIFFGINADKIMAEHGAWVKQGFDNCARDVKRRAEALYAAKRGK